MSAPALDHTSLDASLDDLTGARRWLVGFSGGVDSTVLLHLLSAWCRANPTAPALSAVHINHGLNPLADDWQIHCEWMCKFMHIPCASVAVAVEPAEHGLEAAARESRYRAFEDLLEAGDVLMLGHHLDDQVETFFLRLLRGSGVRGLAAMPAERTLGPARLARPMLHLHRRQLEAYAASHGLQCVEDPSNGDTSLDRNFLRQQLLPQLAERWPGYRQTVARASAHMAGTLAALEEFLPSPETVTSSMGDPGLGLNELLGVPVEAAAMTLRNWLRQRGLQAPDHALLQEFLRQLRDSAPAARPRLQCSAYVLQRYREAIFLLPTPAQFMPPQPLSLQVGDSCHIEGVGRVVLERAPGDGLALGEDELLTLDWRRGGERSRPVGGQGSRSLKKQLQAAAVPPWWRERIPLLYLGDELLASGGLGPCQSSRWRGSGASGERLWQLRWERDGGAVRD